MLRNLHSHGLEVGAVPWNLKFFSGNKNLSSAEYQCRNPEVSLILAWISIGLLLSL